MEHDSSLVPWQPLTPIMVVWDPTLPYSILTQTHTHTHTSAHCFNRLEEIAGKLCQTCSLCAQQNELETTRKKSSYFLSVSCFLMGDFYMLTYNIILKVYSVFQSYISWYMTSWYWFKKGMITWWGKQIFIYTLTFLLLTFLLHLLQIETNPSFTSQLCHQVSLKM